MEEVEFFCKEDFFGVVEFVSLEDVGVMMDFIIVDLEYLEEVENFLKSINDNGSELLGMFVFKEDKEVMIKLINVDIDYFYMLGEFYIDGIMVFLSDGEVEKDDKGIEMEFIVVDI